MTRAITTSRRGTVKTLLGGVLGTLLAGRTQEALACKNFGRTCDRDNDCCAGMKCQNDECTCENGFTKCGARCYDLDTDETHCGACSTVCGAGESCCSGDCVDLNTDRDHCAACAAACAADEICLEGVCTPCPTGNQVCGNVCCLSSQTCCDEVCVDDLDSNANHCGACGNLCPRICPKNLDDPSICSGPRCCSNGECLASLEFDRNNCGDCGHACAAGETCCSGECVDLDSNSGHCGTCGDACRNGRTCCNGACRNLDSDAGNCGECGNDCIENGGVPDASCCAGVCCGDRGGAMRCCADQCLDAGADPLNCGECGLVCASLVCCGAQCCPPLFDCDPLLGECLPPE